MSSATVEYSERSSRRTTGGAGGDGEPTPRGRVAIGVTLIVALLLSAVLQQTAFSYRQAAINRNRTPGAAQPSRLANLDSFSLALLLGGLRGPLVMFLWTNSESQKSEKDLESFDTQVELIRLLQGEFDSVHLFQIWNKAYNISAQLASLANKYSAILDGLSYARKIDQSNPNDINILASMGGLFSDKLGGSSEKAYYISRVRTETLPVYRITIPAGQVEAFRRAVTDAGVDPTRVRINTGGGGGGGAAGAATATVTVTVTATVEKIAGDRVLAAFKGSGLSVTSVARQTIRPESSKSRRNELDTMLDEKGNILLELLKPTRQVPAGSQENDGSELQYLAQFQPFPYGLSPIALGYNYYKRAQYLHRVGKQKHLQLSDLVIDNQPGLNLKAWAEEEWDRGRRLEQRALGATGEAVEKLPRELRTAGLAPDAKVADRASLDEAIFSYDRACLVAKASLPELESHVANFPSNIQNYAGHAQTLRAIIHLTAADARYLQSFLATSAEQRKALREQAKAEYAAAAREYMILTLRFYIEDADARAIGFSRTDIQDKPLSEVEPFYLKTMALLQKQYGRNAPNLTDIEEYDEIVQRIAQRRALLK